MLKLLMAFCDPVLEILMKSKALSRSTKKYIYIAVTVQILEKLILQNSFKLFECLINQGPRLFSRRLEKSLAFGDQ